MNDFILCSFSFTAKENRKSHLQLSKLQSRHFDLAILRVAIISNVQNVRLQHRHRPRQTTTPLVDGVVHNRLVQQTMTHLLRH